MRGSRTQFGVVIRFFFALVLILSTGCEHHVVEMLASAKEESQGQPPKDLPAQEPLLSMVATASAFSNQAGPKSGWFFYVVPSAKGSILDCYLLANGKVERRQVAVASSARVVAEIDAIDLEPFDWKLELKSANERHARSGDTRLQPRSYDGAEWKIVVNTKHGKFEMREWNPGPDIDFYAEYSEKIGKLKRLLDTLSNYEGDRLL